MEQGFVLDESYGSRKPSKWVEGTPEYWFFNLKGQAPARDCDLSLLPVRLSRELRRSGPWL